MDLENIGNAVTDILGDITENIQEGIADIGDISRDAMENLSSESREALENGDIGKAIECSDMPSETKDAANELIGAFNLEKIKPYLQSGAKIAIGSLGTIAALTTPGFQPYGVVGVKSLYDGVSELVSRRSNKDDLPETA